MKKQLTMWRIALSGIAAAMLIGLGVAPAYGAFGLAPGTFVADSFDPATGTTFTQAGGHPPEMTTNLTFNLTADERDVDEQVRDVETVLPAGFVGNPQAAPKCDRAAFDALLGDQEDPEAKCPVDSQVGWATVTAFYPFGPTEVNVPIYNLEPMQGQTAEFGMPVATVPVHIVASVDPAAGYRLKVRLTKVTQAIALAKTTVTFWGVPASPQNDNRRACDGGAYVTAFAFPPVSCSVGAPKTAFLSNPTDCAAGPLTTSIAVDSWANPGAWKTDAYTTASPVTGCDQLRFEPSIDAGTETNAPDAPTGFETKLSFPQNDNPQGIGTPPLRTANVTLPEGLTVNPASAGGLGVCTDAQLGLGTDNALGCPDSSRIGTVTAKTPVLPETLTGGVYLRPQNSADPESGEMFRLAIVIANAERGLSIRLPGSVRADAKTGRLSVTFADNPQLPVSEISLRLKSGPRAPLATPPSCGAKAITAQLSSWGGPSADVQSSFDVACTAGLGGFAPAFEAGTSQPVGGAFSPFQVTIAKPDGNADLTGLSMQLPTGLLASLKGNVGTLVGTVKAFAGPGSNPYMLPGQVFLEGRYGDAPFSLRAVVPAKAGPFDLGEVVVRQKVYVDPITAQVTVVSDPLPTIVKGVPVRLQRLEVDVDKPGFIVNPTSCAAKAVSGTLSSAAGQSVPVTNRFQVSDCASLALKPSLALTLSGKGQTRDGDHPAVSAVLTQKPGQANLKKVRVALPLSLALDPDNAESDGLCSFAEGSKPDPKCPASSVVGRATAISPILNEPLTGPVFFVKNERKDPKSGRSIKTTPKLVIPLTGENGVKLTLTGTSTVADDQLVTTFDNIPDAQVSSFKMDINGGKKGILVISGDKADICKSAQIADQQIDGQNNKSADADVYIQTPSCPTKILSKTVTKTSVKLKVGGLGAGKVTVTGKGIKKTTKTIAKSTVATITAKRTKGKPGKVTVSFDPAGPAKARKATK